MLRRSQRLLGEIRILLYMYVWPNTACVHMLTYLLLFTQYLDPAGFEIALLLFQNEIATLPVAVAHVHPIVYQ